MASRLSLRCACGCEFSVPAGVPIGALVPCPRCALTLRISSVPTTTQGRTTSAGGQRPPSYSGPAPSYAHPGPKRRLGVPAAPGGHVPLRQFQSEVLVNYGLWTLLFGILTTLMPIIPIDGPGWDKFISYQPWAGIIISLSGVLMMIVYQSGPDFARGPGAPLLVAAFWIVGITMAVFTGWIADRVRHRQDLARIAEATAPVMQQMAPPPQQFQPQQPVQPPPQQFAPLPPPQQPPQVPPGPEENDPQRGTSSADAPKSAPQKSAPSKSPVKGPFNIPTDEEKERQAQGKGSGAVRDFDVIKKDLSSDDKRVVLRALEEIQWYFQRNERDSVNEKLVGLLSHPDEQVLLATLKALKTWGTATESIALVPFASHDSLTVRTEAIGLLGKFKDPLGLAALVEALEKDTALAKEALIRAGKSAEAALIKGLKDKSKVVKLECLRIIDTLGLKKAQGDVRRMADYEEDGEVKGEARRVADSLAKKKA